MARRAGPRENRKVFAGELRLDVDALLLLMRQRKYCVPHAPRNTDKTSTLLALRDQLGAGAEFRCGYVNVEVGQTARENVHQGMRAMLKALARAARHALDDRFVFGAWCDTREQLILRRETHLDQLTDKLQDERVRRVIEPLLSGVAAHGSILADDIQYVRDFGLPAPHRPLRVANPIYREVIVRDPDLDHSGDGDPPGSRLVRCGRRDLSGGGSAGGVPGVLARAFGARRAAQRGWNGSTTRTPARSYCCRRCWSALSTAAGTAIKREYGLGRMGTDPLIVRPLAAAGRRTQKALIECKVSRRSLDDVRRGPQAGPHLPGSLRGGGRAPGEFRPHGGQVWEDKMNRRREGQAARDAPVTVWGM